MSSFSSVQTDNRQFWQEKAYAKINLYLHITGKREDGYHLLDSLVVFACAGDEVIFHPSCADDFSLIVTGPFAAFLQDVSLHDNLLSKAALAFVSKIHRSKYKHVGPIGGLIRLIKNLPVASGIGGGSADAAALLRILNRLYPRIYDKDQLLRLALSLGADIPVCFDNRTIRMQGVGGILLPAPILPKCGIVLINPGVALSTLDVFGARKGPYSQLALLPSAWSDFGSMVLDLKSYRNDLEEAALSLNGIVANPLRALQNHKNCALARMSGSGATCFGLFKSVAHAKAAARDLSHIGWWVWGGGLLD